MNSPHDTVEDPDKGAIQYQGEYLSMAEYYKRCGQDPRGFFERNIKWLCVAGAISVLYIVGDELHKAGKRSVKTDFKAHPEAIIPTLSDDQLIALCDATIRDLSKKGYGYSHDPSTVFRGPMAQFPTYGRDLPLKIIEPEFGEMPEHKKTTTQESR